jgi:hypothetical protein
MESISEIELLTQEGFVVRVEVFKLRNKFHASPYGQLSRHNPLGNLEMFIKEVMNARCRFKASKSWKEAINLFVQSQPPIRKPV